MKQYIAFIELDPKSYGVVFPDFPGCISAGDNFEDAVRMAHEALAGHTEFMQESGYPLPKPSSLTEIKKNWREWKDWKNTEYAVSFISLFPKSKLQKFTVSMDAQLLSQIDLVARNRSSFLERAARTMLGDGIGR
jgi:predicted RNase H-like HicB family nuclease